jgi:hypothetical protein
MNLPMSEQIERRIAEARGSIDPRQMEAFLDQWSRSLYAALQMGDGAVLRWIAAVARLVRLNSGVTSAIAAIITALIAEPPVPASRSDLPSTTTEYVRSCGVSDAHINFIPDNCKIDRLGRESVSAFAQPRSTQ